MAKQKIYFMNSALSIPRTVSCALGTFLEKNIVFVFFHIYQIYLWQLNSRSFFLAHAQDIVGIIAILFLVVHVFDRKWVSGLL